MDERIREQYILWTRAAGRSCNDPAEAEAFAGGFADKKLDRLREKAQLMPVLKRTHPA